MFATIGGILLTVGSFLVMMLIMVVGFGIALVHQVATLIMQVTPYVTQCFNWVLTICAA